MRSPLRWPLFALLSLALLPAACGEAESTVHSENLLLISVDTLRADRLGCYAYDRGTSPNLDRLASQGALFLQATAPSPWTLPSHASMFTGLAPRRHAAIGLRSKLSADVTTLAESLLEQKFQTLAIVSSTILKTNGLERGFQSLDLVDTGGPHPSAVTESCIAKLKEIDTSERFFLLAHYIDPHTDYASLEPFRSKFVEAYDGPATGVGQQLYRAISGDIELSPQDVKHLSNLYDGGVAQVDDQIEKLFAYMRSAGLWETTLVLVTSDHGEEFLDHGGLMHGFNHHEEMIRVPLIIRGTGIPAGSVSSVPVSLMDIVPTCLKGLGLPGRLNLDGQSLQDLWQTQGSSLGERNFYYEADWDPPLSGRPTLSKGWDRAIRVGDFKLHLNMKSGEQKLYNLLDDPLEATNLSAEKPKIASAMESELRRYLEHGPELNDSNPELDADQLEALRKLGYAGEEEEEEDDE
jgi:arylsulfatase A-like enzyme